MLHHSLGGGSNFCFFAALYCACLGLNALLALQTKEGGNKGIKSKKRATIAATKQKLLPQY